jgi:hypothetical protein
MKQIRHPDTGQILQEYDEPDPLRDAIQELLNDRLIDSGASTATGDRSITALRLASMVWISGGSLVCDDRPGPTVKLLAEHKAEVLAVLGNSVHESARARASVRPQRACGRWRGWTRDALRGSARTNSRSGRSLPALLRRVRSLWGVRLWRQSTCWAARPLVLRRASAGSAAMNPLGSAPSLSDAARRMRRHREGRRLGLSCIATANYRQRNDP